MLGFRLKWDANDGGDDGGGGIVQAVIRLGSLVLEGCGIFEVRRAHQCPPSAPL